MTSKKRLRTQFTKYMLEKAKVATKLLVFNFSKMPKRCLYDEIHDFFEI